MERICCPNCQNPVYVAEEHLGLPFGIWALVVLTRPEVCDAFQR